MPFCLRIVNDIQDIIKDGTYSGVQILINYTRAINGGSRMSPVGEGCYTIFFPPYLKVNNPPMTPRMPILLTSAGWNHSNNLNFFDSHRYFARMINNAWNYDGIGAILIKSNSGGLGSLGDHWKYQKDVAEIIKMLCRNYYGNKDKLIFWGLSRGGGTSLLLAQNRYRFYDYQPIGVFSSGSPLSIGNMALTPVATNPELCKVYNQIFCDNSAYKYTFNPPPISNPCELIEFIMDTTNPLAANHNSPDGDILSEYFLRRLKNAYVYFQLCDHDGFMRYDASTALAAKLERNNIKHTELIVLRAGHEIQPPAIMGDLLSTFTTELFTNPDFIPRDFDPADYGYNFRHGLTRLDSTNYLLKINYYDHSIPSDYEYLNPPGQDLAFPFVATFPCEIGCAVRDELPNAEPMEISLAGAAGRHWIVNLYANKTDCEEELVGQYSGQFGADPFVDPWAETAKIQFGYEGLPQPTTFTDPEYYRLEIFYDDINDNLIDVSGYTNFVQERGNPESAFALPHIQVKETQPDYPEYYRHGEFSGKQSFGITYWDSMPPNP
jgi:hypothetical protein